MMKTALIKQVHNILRILAILVLSARKPKIIAVTGSVAKTSTKEAIWQVLKDDLKIRKTAGNLNTEIGVPLTILGFSKSPSYWFWWPFFLFWVVLRALCYLLFLCDYPRWLILEMAADKPGDIEYLVSFAKPFISIVTAVGPTHLEAFKTVEAVAQEKGKLIKALPKEGCAILNKEDPMVFKMADKTKARVLFFAPQPNIPSAVASTLGRFFGLTDAKIKERLSKLVGLAGRMRFIERPDGILIIDDSYNANPLSMKYALENLDVKAKEIKARRRIAVLGDMLELGDYSTKGHEEVGRLAASFSDLLLTSGPEAFKIAQAGGGRHFENKEALIDFLKKEIRRGDIILIKASRGMKFEEVVKAITSPRK